MLSKIIVSSYAVFIEISLWLSLLLFVIGGWNFSNPMTGEGGGFMGAIIGLIIWFVIAVVFFGAFLILEDIRISVKRIEEAK
ncbi:MAG TPA: hypothetical protein ENI68_08605 [Gammaproteobacteria bacterium]|nr:hypothetical protein [Gammaproteobacteria bacterium]